MAHECPECGIACHCNGDIDDLLLPNEHHEAACEHCPDDDELVEWQEYGE